MGTIFKAQTYLNGLDRGLLHLVYLQKYILSCLDKLICMWMIRKASIDRIIYLAILFF